MRSPVRICPKRAGWRRGTSWRGYHLLCRCRQGRTIYEGSLGLDSQCKVKERSRRHKATSSYSESLGRPLRPTIDEPFIPKCADEAVVTYRRWWVIGNWRIVPRSILLTQARKQIHQQTHVRTAHLWEAVDRRALVDQEYHQEVQQVAQTHGSQATTSHCAGPSSEDQDYARQQTTSENP